MDMSSWLIIGFTLVIVVPILYMIFTSNIIRAAYAFTLSLLGLAAIYVLLKAELMAVVQIMIYAGGVVVLLIFGIMLTRRQKGMELVTLHRDVALGAGFCMILYALFVSWIGESGLAFTEELVELNQVKTIGISFLTNHILSFEIIAFLLLVALVGAAFLAKKTDSI